MRKLAVALTFFLVLCASLTLADIQIITYGTSAAFSVSPSLTPSYALCQCGGSTDTFTVTNTGAVANNYRVQSDSSLVTLSPASFSLLPEQSQTVSVFIRAPCDQLFTQDLSFTVTDAFGNGKTFVKSLAVDRCQNLHAALASSADNTPVTPCMPVNYSVIVNNTGTFAEEYTVDFGGDEFAQYFDHPSQAMTLSPGSVGVAQATLTLDCSQSGSFLVPFHVEATNNGLVADLAHDLQVMPAYNFSGDLQIDPMCTETGGKASFSLTNDATFSNSFSLDTDPDMLSLDMANVSLAPGEDRSFSLTIPAGTAPGSYNASVTVTEAMGQTSKSFTAPLEVLSCFGVAVAINASADPVTGCAGTYTFPVTVTNHGVDDETIALTTDNAVASLRKDSLSLAPGESAQTTLTIDAPSAEALTGDVVVTASVGETGVSASETLSLSLVSSHTCFQPLLEPEKVQVPLWQGSFNLSLQNNGWQPATYTVSAASDLFTVPNGSFTLAPGDAVSVPVQYAPSDELYRRYAVDVIVAGNGESYSFPLRVVLDSPTALEDASWYLWTHPCELVSAIALLLIIVGLVWLFVRPKALRARVHGLLRVLLLAWVIIVIVILVWKGLPGPLYQPVVQDQNDPLTLYIPEDASYTADLSSFFVDPDMDNMTFMVSNMDDVLVKVDGSSAVFTPSPNYAGKESFIITAFDGHGGATDSPTMYAVVVDRPELTPWTVYVKYCPYLNLLLLLIVVFLAEGVCRRRKKPLPAVAKKQGRKKAKK